MKHSLNLCLAALCLVFLFAGCEADEPLNLVEPDSKTPTVEEISSPNKSQESGLPIYFEDIFKSAVVNTYTIAYENRIVTGTGEGTTTTFNFLVSGGGLTPQLDSFSLELPACSGMPLSYSPEQPTKISGNLITWNNSVSKDGSQMYSLTFKGDIPLGLISSTVTRGSLSETKEILGPCKGLYTLSGSIYIDANGDKMKQDSESGIPNFPIDLKDESGSPITTVYTSTNGSYSFTVLKGTYTISVNTDLLRDENYTAAGSTSIYVKNVQADNSNNNFGYWIDSEKITRELDNKTIIVNTQPTKFWVQQIRNAGKKGSLYTKEEIRGLLVSIESLLLAEPFQFGADKEAAALKILSNPIRTEMDAFLQQLLTAELNVTSGRGALINPTTLNTPFNTALLIYSEAIACQELGSCPVETVTTAKSGEVKAVSSTSTRMLLSFNGSGGV